MKTFKDQAFVISSINFKEYDQIVTVFTKEKGLIQLFARGARRLKNSFRTLVQPLQLIEIDYFQRKSSLFSLQEGYIIQAFPYIRNSYDHLEAAFAILSILKSELEPEQASPLLFELIYRYFTHFFETKKPLFFSLSFALKLLKHEGKLNSCLACQSCNSPILEGGYCEGDWFCNQHMKSYSIPLSISEVKLIKAALFIRSFGQLKEYAGLSEATDIEKVWKKLFQ